MTVADFALQLKTETKKSHTAAENTKFVGSFLRGVVSKESYKQLVANFYFIYRAMEEELDKLKEDPIISKISFEALNRTESLAQDCRYYYGPNWRDLITPSEACQRYVNRIREVAEDDPELLVGHHYTRYLGDLSGGQILKNIAQNALQPRDGEGLKFYDFPRIDNAKEWKVKYRSTLDTLELDQSQVDALIAEANNAFRLNMLLFDELKGNASKSLFKVIIGFVKSKLSGENK